MIECPPAEIPDILEFLHINPEPEGPGFLRNEHLGSVLDASSQQRLYEPSNGPQSYQPGEDIAWMDATAGPAPDDLYEGDSSD